MTLTDPKLRSQVDALWDKFWTGGLANPLDAIEQFSHSTHRPEGFFQALDFSTQAFGMFLGATLYD